MSKTERHRHDRRKSKQKLKEMARNLKYRHGQLVDRQERNFRNSEAGKLNLPSKILNKPFSRLDNQEVRTLVKALRERYDRF